MTERTSAPGFQRPILPMIPYRLECSLNHGSESVGQGGGFRRATFDRPLEAATEVREA
jgi:hypothetical protein